jgi:hypothetical protein
MTSKNRNHFYLFTVETRHEFDKPVTDVTGNVKKDAEGNVKTYRAVEWISQKVIACNMHEVAGKLQLDMGELRYLYKEIIK